MPEVTAIVAATLQNGIGKNGGLPWRLPGEMKYFQRVTVGSGSLTDKKQIPPNALIMGRKTWESIPPKFRPLGGRRNLVVTRAGVELGDAPHSSTHSSLPAAISAAATKSTSSTTTPPSRIFLMGGAQLYNESLTASPPLVNRVLLTRVISKTKPAATPEVASKEEEEEEKIECDTFLDDFSNRTDPDGNKIWKLASHAELQEYVGFEVQEGEVQEKGYRYRFELWELV